jgi:hypothetical protein
MVADGFIAKDVDFTQKVLETELSAQPSICPNAFEGETCARIDDGLTDSCFTTKTYIVLTGLPSDGEQIDLKCLTGSKNSKQIIVRQSSNI